MAKKNSAVVSLKREELEQLSALHRVAWGSYDNKTVAKLERAIARIDAEGSD